MTRREHEVCALVVAGKLNKQIAAALGTSEKTVKVHRARVMAKMQAASLAELVSTVERLNRAQARDHAQSPTPTPGYRHEAGENGHLDVRRSAS
jgi:DNA-binding CsgD family transcriptional regulator